MAEDQSKNLPPYLPYKTLIGSLENLAQGIPPKLDRTIWKNQPGSVQSQILSAYRFFGLMDDSTSPTPLLEKLVHNRQTPTATFKPVLEEKYSKIIDLGLSTMTTAMISKAFEDGLKVEGETKKKAIRFFLQAAKANGLHLSKFLLDQTRVPSGPRKRKLGKRADEVADGSPEDEEQPSASGMQRVITLRSGGQLSFSLSVDLFALSGADRKFVFGLIDSLQDYEATSADGRQTAEASTK